MINLVLPMAGRGSRFLKAGNTIPKPLMLVHGKPFFWWAIRSVERVTSIDELICIVLQEHVDYFDIDTQIKHFFPEARFVVLSEVTAGAFDTALIGINTLTSTKPILINDCDHAFDAQGIASCLAALNSHQYDALLCHFHSTSPNFSYAQYHLDGILKHTAEKKVISNLAIAGLYGFHSPAILREIASTYRAECVYDELFISGVFNLLAQKRMHTRGFLLPQHVSFGTPEELIFSKNKTDLFEYLTG